MADKTDRRCFLARGVLGAAAVGAVHASIEEKTLVAAMQDGAAQTGTGEKPKTDIPPGSLPCGKIGNVSLSRLFIGGNLIGGWAHSRDLMYASKLFTSYNTEAKVFETLGTGPGVRHQHDPDGPACWDAVTKYNQQRSHQDPDHGLHPAGRGQDQDERRRSSGRSTWAPRCSIRTAAMTDTFMMNGGKIDVIGQMVDLIKAQGVPAGVGGHSLNMPMACEKNKLNADFYVKTFHMDRYWSATPKERRKEYDWMRGQCRRPRREQRQHVVQQSRGDGGLHGDGREAVGGVQGDGGRGDPAADGASPTPIRNGADFIIAGMFDFQVETDVKIAIESLQKVGSRKRPWRG